MSDAAEGENGRRVGGAAAGSNTPEQPGLRRRMRSEGQRIQSQHRQLGGFFAAIELALSKRGAGHCADECRRLADALEAHLDVEEQLFFPALHGLRPDLTARLEELLGDHRSFRGDLELLRGDNHSLEASFIHAFAKRFEDHESREEALVEEAQRERAGR